MRRIILSSVAYPAVQYYSTAQFSGKVTENEMYFDFPKDSCLKQFLFYVRRTEPDIIINVHTSSCKVPVIYVRF